ncbi:MAG TPA: type I secretion C-terminal target domain-containing protein, partial [Chroococcidiopsis sp.]
GRDVLVGGEGRDILTGGAGKDVFTFNSLKDGVDTVRDFRLADDVLDLRTIFKQAAFQDATSSDRLNQFVQVVQVGSDTQVKIDTDGIGAGTAFTTLAVLKNVVADNLTGKNFVIG